MLKEKEPLINQLIALVLCVYTIDLVVLYILHRNCAFITKGTLLMTTKT